MAMFNGYVKLPEGIYLEYPKEQSDGTCLMAMSDVFIVHIPVVLADTTNKF